MAATNAEPAARLLDITRLISRAGRGPLTGIDRVEKAYLERLSGETVPLFLLARTNLGFILLNPDAAQPLLRRITGAEPWGAADLLSRLARIDDAARAGAEADLRRLSLDRCRPSGLGGMLRRHLPAGAAYLNVGHSDLSADTLAAIRAAGLRIAVMIHDTIPLDYPELSGPGAPASFAARLRAVGEHAHLVICNSEATRKDVNRHLPVPASPPAVVVAHLGVDIPVPDTSLPPSVPTLTDPYFVTVGTIEPRKNHALLLEVWAALERDLPPARIPQLVIAGRRGWGNAAVFRTLDTAPFIGRSVFELPDLADGALASLLSGARALLFPSLAEGFGLPPLEAAALGVPVVAAPLAVYRETLGEFAVYADAGDPYSWRKTIMDLAQNTGQAGKAAEKGRGTPAIPTWSSHFNTILALT